MASASARPDVRDDRLRTGLPHARDSSDRLRLAAARRGRGPRAGVGARRRRAARGRIVALRPARLGARAGRVRRGDEALPVTRALLADQPPSRSHHRGVAAPVALARHRLHASSCPVCLHAARRGPGRDPPAARAGQQPHALRSAPRREPRPVGAGRLPAVLGGGRQPCRPHLVSGAPIPIWVTAALGTLAARVADDAAGAWAHGFGSLAGWDFAIGRSTPRPQLLRRPTATGGIAARTAAPDRSRTLDLQDQAAAAHRADHRDQPLHELAARAGAASTRESRRCVATPATTTRRSAAGPPCWTPSWTTTRGSSPGPSTRWRSTGGRGRSPMSCTRSRTWATWPTLKDVASSQRPRQLHELPCTSPSCVGDGCRRRVCDTEDPPVGVLAVAGRQRLALERA